MEAFSDSGRGPENSWRWNSGILWFTLAFSLGSGFSAPPSPSGGEIVLFRHEPTQDPSSARLKVDLSVRSPHAVNPLLFGKFTEHLGQNIYNGIDAQILINPTFEKWAFSAGDGLIDGGFKEETDAAKIKQQVMGQARWQVAPGPVSLLEGYQDGAAFGWRRLGSKESILLSPDVGPYGGRAQRVEIRNVMAGQSLGLFQPVYLPLHRTQKYQFRIIARSMTADKLKVGIAALDAGGRIGAMLASQEVALGKSWAASNGILSLPAGSYSKADAVFAFTVSVSLPAHFLIDSLLVYPDDHVNYADPDFVRFYKDARLPLMRWPGGNFVSGYHWRDGIGPIDRRPTRPNPAWGALEYNFFGTDEFIVLCRAIGCEPLVCVNAGNGTPEEAAAWVEYCNGSRETSMGRLRAANGHPEPYGVKYWEVGNEVYGRWQIAWTTPAGYVDRYARFAAAMKAAPIRRFSFWHAGTGITATTAGTWPSWRRLEEICV